VIPWTLEPLDLRLARVQETGREEFRKYNQAKNYKTRNIWQLLIFQQAD